MLERTTLRLKSRPACVRWTIPSKCHPPRKAPLHGHEDTTFGLRLNLTQVLLHSVGDCKEIGTTAELDVPSESRTKRQNCNELPDKTRQLHTEKQVTFVAVDHNKKYLSLFGE